MQKEILLQGAFLLLLGIILGAFGAHYIKDLAEDPEIVTSYETGVRYQLYHGIALLIFAFQAHKFPFSIVKFTRMIMVGVSFFSGSLYVMTIIKLLSLYNPPVIIALCTPLGGIILVFAWGYLIYKVMRYL